MSLPWKIVFLFLLGSVSFLLYRDLTFDRSQVASVMVSSHLRNGSERLKPNNVNSNNSHHELGAENIVTGRNNIVSNNGILSTNDLKSILPKRTTRYFRGSLKYHSCGSLSWVTFDGSRFQVGMPCEFGRVVVVDRGFVVCVSDDGFVTTYLLPFDLQDFDESARVSPSARFTSSADGVRARASGSWYCSHTGTFASD